ncbi:MAG TPA: oxidoreductase, partial [Devosiaceae bacterium]|nr:oxidoreductase [Devosiaceae bacterium]
AALEALVKSYAGEMQTTSVRTNVFNPGPVRTAMRAKAMPGEDPDTLPPPSDIAPSLIDMIAPGYAVNGMLFSFPTKELKAL